VAAASVAQHVLDRRQRLGLLALGRDPAREQADGLVRVKTGRGRDQLAAVLSALGRIELGASKPLADVVSGEKEDLTWGCLVVVMTPRMTEGSVPAVVGLRKAGFETSVVLVGRGADPAADAARLEAVGIRASRVITEADIGGLDF